MRDLRRKPGQLANLPVHSRMVYSSFLVFTLIGLAVAGGLYQAGPSLDLEETATYYAGGEVLREGPTGAELGAPAEQATSTGPELDLDGLDDPLDTTAAPEESEASTVPATIVRPPIDARHLMEITHGHLFLMPILLLVICHLFVLAGLPKPILVSAILLGHVAVVTHIAAPWLIRDVSRELVVLLPLSGVALFASLGGMAICSLVVMWLPRRAALAREVAEEPASTQHVAVGRDSAESRV